MKTIKIIDLLNKIANGEEVPKKIKYQGDITKESDRWILNMPIELIPAAARMMAEVANYFKKRIEKD